MNLAMGLRKRVDRRLPAGAANFWIHLSEGVFASFAGELLAAGVVFPMLAAALGVSPAFLGVLAAVESLGFVAPLVAAPRVEAVRRKKRLVLFLGIGQRLPLAATALLLLFLARPAPRLCLILIALLNLGTVMVVSVLVPPWLDLVAETIPKGRVGRLFGFRSGASAAMGLAAGAACTAILSTVSFPGNFALLYVAGFASMVVSWLLFALVDELPADAAPKQAQPARRYFRDLVAAIRRDRAYLYYLAYQGIGRLGFVATPFYAMAAALYYGAGPRHVGLFIASGAAARIVGNFAFSFLDPRIGHKRMLGLGAALHGAAALLAASAPSAERFAGVFFLGGLGAAAQTVSGNPFLMEICPRGRRIGYMSMSQAVLAPVGMAAAPLAGWFMEAVGHGPLFALAAVAILAALLPLERCAPNVPTEKPSGKE